MIKTPLSTVIGGAGIWTPGCTVLGSMQKTLDQLIKSMFANNEQGFTRTPDDLSTMYQDAAGTIPVTAAGQPIGLALDKSKALALGNEIVINGNFANGKTSWNDFTGVSTVSNGTLTLTNPIAPPTGYTEQILSVTPGKAYRLSGEATNGTIATFTGGGVQYSSTTSSMIFVATSSTLMLRLMGVSNGVSTFKNVSIKELAGNHSYQTTSAMRPLLQNAPRRIDYDAVDDKLRTTLPAQLTGCTVIRAVPNVGTQILTNQTIPTPYNDSTDHCGLIVINRDLTTAETAQITQLFNKAAGV